MVRLGADLLLANAGAAADVVVEASAVAVEGLGPLAQRKHPLHQGQGAAQQAHIHIGPVEAIEGRTEAAAARDEDARIGLAPGDAEVGVFLVILQQHIEVGLMVLDQVGFQRQRLGFAVGHDELDLADLPHHQGDARAVGVAATALEIAAHPVAQHLRLADVEDPVLAIPQQVAARFRRHLLEARLELRRLLDQAGRHGRGVLEAGRGWGRLPSFFEFLIPPVGQHQRSSRAQCAWGWREGMQAFRGCRLCSR